MDTILNTAEEGAKDMYNPGWYIYLPTSTDLSNDADNVTKTPVQEIPSDFVGKSLEEVASILISASKDVDLNRQFFAVCDKRTESDGSLVLCYVAAKESDEGKVDWLRCRPKNVSLYLRGLSMSGPTWDELKTAWERKKAKGEDVID